MSESDPVKTYPHEYDQEIPRTEISKIYRVEPFSIGVKFHIFTPGKKIYFFVGVGVML